MTANDTRLIILRGPCGAGKSTVASRLLGYDFERVIAEHSALDDTVRSIRNALA